MKLNNGDFMKMRILNYYCGQKDEECRSMMCTREEAACLTVEYVLAAPNSKTFPDSRLVKHIQIPEKIIE